MNKKYLSVPGYENIRFIDRVDSQTVSSDAASFTEYLLDRFSKEKAKEIKVLDIGCGTGILSFMLKINKPHWTVWGIDIQEHLIETAKDNVKNNQIDNLFFQITDVRDNQQATQLGLFDTVISNPPYYRSNQGILSPVPEKAIARHEVSGKMSDFLSFAKSTLKPEGKAFFLYPESRETEFLETAHQTRLKCLSVSHCQNLSKKTPIKIYELGHA